MESQEAKEFHEELIKQFFQFDKVNRQKFLRYLVILPDLVEKGEIETFLNNIYLDNIDEGEKIAEELLRLVLTLKKDQKEIFVEYLTRQLNDEDSLFVFNLLGKNDNDDGTFKENENIATDMELGDNIELKLNELGDFKEEKDIIENMELARTGEKNDLNPNKIVGNRDTDLNIDALDSKEDCIEKDSNHFQNNSKNELLEDLIKQFFRLNKASRQNFLRYLVMMPDIVEKKDIESFLDTVHLDSNDRVENFAENLLKMVLTLEKYQKNTFVEYLTKRLNDEDATFVSQLLANNPKVIETLAKDLALEENGEKLDKQLKKILNACGINLKVCHEVTINAERDSNYFRKDSAYENCFENNILLVKMKTGMQVGIQQNENTKSGVEDKINNFFDYKHKMSNNINNVDTIHKSKIDELNLYTKRSDLEENRVEEDSIYFGNCKQLDIQEKIQSSSISKHIFESDNLLIKIKTRLPAHDEPNNPKINRIQDYSEDIQKYCEQEVKATSNLEIKTEYGQKKIINQDYENKLDSEEDLESDNTTITCNICTKQYSSAIGMKQHVDLFHSERNLGQENLGQFHCELCGKTFSQKYSFKQHKDGVCKVCDKKCMAPAVLKIHRRSHTGEKPFRCDKCGTGFTRRNFLTRHSHIHSKSKKFFCNRCPKAFFQFGNLKIHEKIHMGEKAYVCELCQKSFVQKSNLKSHKVRCYKKDNI